MTTPNGLPYTGALDAVQRIEAAIAERDAARVASDAALDAAHAEADRLLAAARAAGNRAGEERRRAILAEARADVETVRAHGDAAARRLGERAAKARDELAAEFTALLLAGES